MSRQNGGMFLEDSRTKQTNSALENNFNDLSKLFDLTACRAVTLSTRLSVCQFVYLSVHLLVRVCIVVCIIMRMRMTMTRRGGEGGPRMH